MASSICDRAHIQKQCKQELLFTSRDQKVERNGSPPDIERGHTHFLPVSEIQALPHQSATCLGEFKKYVIGYRTHSARTMLRLWAVHMRLGGFYLRSHAIFEAETDATGEPSEL
jgi:hypothetical protein